MGKVILTEGQYQRLKRRLINNMINEADAGATLSYAAAGAATGAALGGGIGAIPGALIGAAYGLFASSGGSKSGVEAIFNACNAKGVGGSTMNGGTLDSIASKIRTAIVGMGTDEDAIKAALSQVATIPDLCAVKKRYAENYPGSTLFDDLDGDIDDDSEWNEYVYLPLLGAKRKTEELSKKAAEAAKTGAAGGGGSAKTIADKYYGVLFQKLTEAGIGVKMGNGFLYWGPWVIWRDQNKNGGYPITKGSGATIESYKFMDGNYIGRSMDTQFVIQKGNEGVPIKFSDLIGSKKTTPAKTASGGGGSKPAVSGGSKPAVSSKPTVKTVQKGVSKPSTPVAPSPIDYGSSFK